MEEKDKNKVRLNRALAMSGFVSRRQADNLIRTGKVKVNGKIVSTFNCKVGLSDRIEVENKLVRSQDYKYVVFYKPPGYLTTTKDEFNRKTIYDLLPFHFQSLKPIGRLDRDSEGLLLLSNDGMFIHKIMHPASNIKKTYIVKIEGDLSEKEVNSIKTNLLSGIKLNQHLVKVDSIKLKPLNNPKKTKQTLFEVVIHEGINRQLRKMFQMLGYSVRSLVRTKIGNLTIESLHRGEYKELIKRKAYEALHC